MTNDPANFYARLQSSIDADTRRERKALRPSDATPCSAAYSDHLIVALRCLDDEGLLLLTVELAKRIGGKVGNRGMCLRHHEWDRTTISGMRCIHCKETTDTAHFIYEPNTLL